MTNTSTPSPAKGRSFAILAALCWGAATVMSKSALAAFAPITLLVVQLLASVVCLWALVLIRNAKVRRLPLGTLVKFASLGLLEPGLTYLLALVGLQHTRASTASLIGSSEAMMIIAFSVLLFAERPTLRFMLLSIVAIFGLYVSLGTIPVAVSGSEVWGNTLIFAGTATAAVYVVLSGRIAAKADPVLLVAWQQTVALGMALLTLPLEWAWRSQQVALPSATSVWLLAAASGVIQYALAFTFYMAALKTIHANVAGTYLNLIPIFGIAGAAIFLGELISMQQLVGAAITLAAVTWMSLDKPLPTQIRV
jgi:drug/metabolite transporter (DMT)-like permease